MSGKWDDPEYRREYHREWRRAKLDKLRPYWRQWYHTNKERLRERYGEIRRKRSKARYVANKDKILELQRKYRAANRERIHAKARLYWASHPKNASQKERQRTIRRQTRIKKAEYYSRLSREYLLNHKYGLSIAQYEQMCEKQKGKCAICGEIPPKRLCVDHDHLTGKVRGLLCIPCNAWLARFENENLMRKATQYLAQSLAKPTTKSKSSELR